MRGGAKARFGDVQRHHSVPTFGSSLGNQSVPTLHAFGSSLGDVAHHQSVPRPSFSSASPLASLLPSLKPRPSTECVRRLC